MRYLTILCVLILSASVWADDAGNSRKVRVALALAATSGCGECRFDEDKCRAEAAAANKPLVLFVGEGCAKLGTVAKEAGAVACVVESYDRDGRPPKEARAVVLSPNPAGGFFKETVLSPTDTTIKAAVEKAKPQPKEVPAAKPSGKKLDWGSGFKLEWNDLTPTAQQRLLSLADAPAVQSAPTAVVSPVQGVWSPSAPAWHPALPATVPQRMPGSIQYQFAPGVQYQLGGCPGGVCPTPRR